VVHRAQWGQLTLGDEPGSTSMTRKVLFSFPKAHTDAEEKLAKEQFHRYMEHAEKQRAADLTYLCSLINKNLFGWWD
jgi:hypothetical protein